MGSSWPSIQETLSVPLSFVSILAITGAIGTIASSMFSSQLIRKFGTEIVSAVSVLMTASALFGYSMATAFWQLCILTIPLGIGAGAVDAALNNYVALHYKARDMNWLHCFWGVGATIGPIIMSFYLDKAGGWRRGYLNISMIQICLTMILLMTLPLWKQVKNSKEDNNDQLEEKAESISLSKLLKLPGASSSLIAFFCYSALEITVGLWGSSFCILTRGVNADTAARWISFFYLGITFSRFISGFITMKADSKKMIRFGTITMGIGILCFFIPMQYALQMGLVIIGFGCAPIYPSMLHETPNRFNKAQSQSIMGVQMACSYLGALMVPSIFGFIAEYISIELLPFYLLVFFVIMLYSNERVNAVTKKHTI